VKDEQERDLGDRWTCVYLLALPEVKESPKFVFGNYNSLDMLEGKALGY
jgi:hypothetical protein